MLTGRFISDRDMEGKKYVAVVSDKLVNNMFGGDAESAVGKKVKVYTDKQIMAFTVVGVYEYEASSFAGTESEQEIRTDFIIPVTLAKRLANAGNNYQSFTLVSSETADSAALAANIESFFQKFYDADSKFTVSARSMES
jgi:putative ABC transport system permease protein